MKGKSSMSVEEWRGDSPVGLRRYGVDFVTVGKDALQAHRKRNPPTLIDEHIGELAPDAVYYNFLHGVELGLKSYLRHVDAVPLKELRSRPYGHNLCSLLDESIRFDLRARCPRLEDDHIEAIRCSSECYMQKELEYIEIGFAKYPAIDVVSKAAEALISELRKLPMQPAKQPTDQPDRKNFRPD